MNQNNILNISEVKKAILHSNNMKQTISDHNVLFLGFSGTGKSTSILALSGEEMLGYHTDMKAPVLINKNGKKSDPIFIEDEFNSGTKEPAVKEIKGQSISLWDLPGLGESRGITQTLINAFYIQKIFSIHSSVKLIFTINYHDLVQSEKGKNLGETVGQITRSLSHFKDYHKSLAIMITKASPHCTQEDVRKTFSAIKSTVQIVKSNKHAVDFFDYAIKKEIPILILPYPKLSQKSISKSDAICVTDQYKPLITKTIDVITKLIPAKTPKISIGMTISSSDKQKCKELINDTKTNLDQNESQFINGLIPFIVSFFNKSISFDGQIQFVQAYFSKIKQVLKFIDNLMNICKTTLAGNTKAASDIEFLNFTMKSIISLCENPSISYRCEGAYNKCTNLQKLHQLYPIVDFLSVIDFSDKSEYDWINVVQVMRGFFSRIKEQQSKINDIIYQQKKTLSMKIQMFGVQKMQEYLQCLKKSSYLQEWRKSFRMFPASILLLSNYNSSSNFIDYIKIIQDDGKRMNAVSKVLFEYQTVLEFQKTYLNRVPSMEESGKTIKEMILAFGVQQVHNLCNFEEWNQEEAETFRSLGNDHDIQPKYYPLDITNDSQKVRYQNNTISQQNKKIKTLEKDISDKKNEIQAEKNKNKAEIKEKNKEIQTNKNKMQEQVRTIQTLREKVNFHVQEEARLRQQIIRLQEGMPPAEKMCCSVM